MSTELPTTDPITLDDLDETVARLADLLARLTRLRAGPTTGRRARQARRANGTGSITAGAEGETWIVRASEPGTGRRHKRIVRRRRDETTDGHRARAEDELEALVSQVAEAPDDDLDADAADDDLDASVRLAEADARFERAREAYEEASDERRLATLAAYESGMTMAEIARQRGVTHEAVRKVVRAVEDLRARGAPDDERAAVVVVRRATRGVELRDRLALGATRSLRRVERQARNAELLARHIASGALPDPGCRA